MTITETKTAEMTLLTADDLLRLHSEAVRGELIRGVLVETMTAGVEHGEIVMNLGAELRNFIKAHKLGRLMGSDSGVRLERDPDTVREPDIAFTSAQRMPLGTRIQGCAEVAPDLVVEIKSPFDSRREIHDKARMWLSHGVRLVWVIHPDPRTVDIHRPGRAISTLTIDDTLDGADVLPGFTVALTEVFDT